MNSYFPRIYIGGVAQVVERSLSMWEVPGSIPGISRNFLFILLIGFTILYNVCSSPFKLSTNCKNRTSNQTRCTTVSTIRVWIIKLTHSRKRKKSKMNPPRRGIEPRSPAWQAGILTTILPRTPRLYRKYKNLIRHLWLQTPLNKYTHSPCSVMYPDIVPCLLWALQR